LQHDNAWPILPLQLLQQSKICPSSVFHICHTRPQWFSCVWTAQTGDGRQVFQVRWRGPAGGARVAALSAKQIFLYRGIHALLKHWNTCIACTGDYVEKWSHCVPFVFNK
jgi:hypothetical protein